MTIGGRDKWCVLVVSSMGSTGSGIGDLKDGRSSTC